MEQNSKIQAIKEFIEMCPLLKNGKIIPNYLKEENYSYAIVQRKEDIILTKYKDGGSIRQIPFNFVVQFPISNRSIENLANSKFGEDFINWIEEQDSIGNLPKITNVQHIECTQRDSLIARTNTQSVFEIPMRCTYYQA